MRFLGFRFFLWIGVVVLLVGFFKHVAWLYIAYIAVFPFIVLFWKIPRFVYRRGSWLFFVGLVNAGANALQSLRYSVMSKGLALIAAVAALTTHTPAVVFCSGAYLLLLLVWSYWRTVRAAFTRSRFLAVQDDAINSLMDTAVVKSWTELGADFRRSDVEVYSQQQLQLFSNNLTFGVLLNRALYFWAYQLEQYRQTVATLILSLVSWFLLLLATIASLPVVNIALYHVDASQFTTDGVPTVLQMALYSFSNLALNAAAGIDADGDWASIVRIVAGLLGVVLLLGILVNIIFSIRTERDSSAIAETVARLKQRAASVEVELLDQYEVLTVDEAVTRLERLGAGLIGLVTYLTRNMPPGFIEDGTPDE